MYAQAQTNRGCHACNIALFSCSAQRWKKTQICMNYEHEAYSWRLLSHQFCKSLILNFQAHFVARLTKKEETQRTQRHLRKQNFVFFAGFYECEDGTILKALHPDPDPRGPREVAFYQKVFDKETKDPVLLELRSFLPKYVGLQTKEEQNRTSRSFLIRYADVLCCSAIKTKAHQFIFSTKFVESQLHQQRTSCSRNNSPKRKDAYSMRFLPFCFS